MNQPASPLQVSVSCKESPTCVYTGTDLKIEIKVANQGQVEVGFPQEFKQKTGPSIKLEGVNLKTNLADQALMRKFKKIKPGESIVMNWIIFAGEIKTYGLGKKELEAVVTVFCDIEVNKQLKPFSGTAVLRIRDEATKD